MGRKLGLFRAVYLVSASCMGSFAFAFDTGIISSSIINLKICSLVLELSLIQNLDYRWRSFFDLVPRRLQLCTLH